jgi:hypothetical protein
MACTTLVTADIVADCTKIPVKGLKPKAWIFNAGEVTLTVTNNIVSNLVKVSGKTSFTVEGFKDFMNAGYDAVVAENFPTVFKHKFMVDSFAATGAERANIDKADNIIVIVETNNSPNEGCFQLYGYKNGLWKDSQAQMANDANSVTKVSFASRAGMEEEYSAYSLWLTNYATTLALLTASET